MDSHAARGHVGETSVTTIWPVKLLRRTPDSVEGQILAHYRTVWPGDPIESVHWTPGPLPSRLPELHIAKIPPSSTDESWKFATVGAWRATHQEDHGLEFVAAAGTYDSSLLLRLGMTAYYHAGPPENRLGAGHTLSIGEGWIEGSPLDALLVSLPYPWGPKLEHCLLKDRHIQVLWLLPIYEVERQFIKTNGLEALEQRFDDAGFNYLDPFRPPVIGLT